MPVCEPKPKSERRWQKQEKAGGSGSHAGMEKDYPRWDVNLGLGAGGRKTHPGLSKCLLFLFKGRSG